MIAASQFARHQIKSSIQKRIANAEKIFGCDSFESNHGLILTHFRRDCLYDTTDRLPNSWMAATRR
jgi:hypothetical protein